MLKKILLYHHHIIKQAPMQLFTLRFIIILLRHQVQSTHGLYVNLSEGDFRRSLKEAGVDDWFIYVVLFMLDPYYRKGIAAQVFTAVGEVIGKKPISFSQFAKDYVQAFN